MKPNRAQRRKMKKAEAIHHKPKYSLIQVQRAMNIAVEMKRLTKGHLWTKHLKSRCVWCGVTDRTKKECRFWFLTFMDRMQVVLINPEFFKDNEIEAYFIQAKDDYADVKVPVNVKA